MTGDSTRNRLSAIFFAFVMVTSMVAVGAAGFAGSAAAEEVTADGSTSLNAAYGNIGDTDDGEADTIVVDADASAGPLVVDGSDDLTIRAADGTFPTITDGNGGDAIQINSDVDVTIEGVEIQGQADDNIINANDLTEASTLSVVNSTLDVDSGGSNAFGIRTNAGSAGEGGTVDVQNVTFEDTSGDDNEEAGIFAYKATEVSVTESTFDGLDFGIQTPDVPTVTVQDSSFTALQDEGIILNNENDDAYAPAVTITGNEFGTINGGSSASTAVLFLEDTLSNGKSVGDNFDDSNGIQVTNNNFNDSTGYAIATTTGFTANQGSDTDQADLGITIDATNNFYNSDLGPVVEDETGTETRSIPTEYANDGNAAHIVGVNADFRPFRVGPAPDGASVDFDFDNAIDQANEDERTNVNASFAGNVNESTVSVYAVNTNTNPNNNQTLVENGEVVGDSNVIESTLDGSNDGYEFVSLNATLQEGTTDLKLYAQDQSGTNIFSSNTVSTSGTDPDMTGRDLKVIPDPSNPQFEDPANADGGSITDGSGAADINVVAVDRFGNELTKNEADANAETQELAFTFDDASNVSIADDGDANNEDGDAPDVAPVNSSGYTVDRSVAYSNAGDLEITAIDTGSSDRTLNSGTATQTFTGTVDDIQVSVDSDTVASGGTDTVNVTATLVDANDDPVLRQVGDISFSFTNNSAISVDKTFAADGSGQSTLDTFAENGSVRLQLTASQSGQDITATGVLSSPSVSDTAEFRTVAGDISTTESSITVAGTASDIPASQNVKVATQHPVLVDLEDSNGNAIEAFDVTLSSNATGASFGSTELTTNASGQASTTVTLPEQKGTTAVNVTAGDFNASGTGNAQVNVTTVADNVTQLRFGSDASPSIAPNSQDNTFTVEAADQFDNLNASTGSLSSVTLTSSDTAVLDFDGSESSTVSLGSNGQAAFNVDANGTGTATLDATIPDSNISNTSFEVTVADPAAIQLTPAHNVVTSDAADGANQATLEAQFVNANGVALGVPDENITFAKQSGSAAELNQSDTFTKSTDSNGNVTIDVNGTATTGDTSFIALAENFSVQGTATVTTTGPADGLSVTPENDSVSANGTTNVTVEFVDTEGRNVPIVDTNIQLSTDNGEVTDSPQPTTLGSDGQVATTLTYNASSGSAGTANLTAVGGGVSGTASVTVTGADDGGDVPTDAQERALQITGKDDPANLTQDDVTAVITQFERGETVNGVDPAQDDVTTVITLFERN